MRAFTCPVCSQLVFFENSKCLRCGSPLAFDPERRELVALDADAPRSRCANAGLVGCNWLAPAPGALCESCALTRTRPSDTDAEGLGDFARAEHAKRRLLFDLGEHGLPVEGWREREGGLAFELLSSSAEAVTTGHAQGVITLDLAEADAAHRETMREQLGEPYRTVLGHFRHEIGHYYWPLLVESDPGLLADYRARFGDEREDYGAALERHYAQGPPPDWAARHVSAYAASHPWEDWAETWAHFLHITDALQTAAYGLRTPLAAPDARHADIAEALRDWLPLAIAMNQMNRSMGREDLYPFVITAPVAEKLAFVQRAVSARGRRRETASGPAPPGGAAGSPA